MMFRAVALGLLAFHPSVAHVSASDCPGKIIEEEYNIEIELYNIADRCDQNDFIKMGKLVREVVADADERFPKWEDEFMKTNICIDPNEVTEDMQERLLWMKVAPDEVIEDMGPRAHLIDDDLHPRRLGRYYLKYLGGGRCRRCQTDSIDRRSLGNTGYDRQFLRLQLPRALKARDPKQIDGKRFCHRLQQEKAKNNASEKDLREIDEAFDEILNVVMISGPGSNDLVTSFRKAEKEHQKFDQAQSDANMAWKRIEMQCREVDRYKQEEKLVTREEKEKTYNEIGSEIGTQLSVVSSATQATKSARLELRSLSQKMQRKVKDGDQTYRSENVCLIAKLAEYGKVDAETAVDRIVALIKEVKNTVKSLDETSKQSSFVKEAEKNLQECEKCVEEADRAIASASSLCQRAQKVQKEENLMKLAQEAAEDYTRAMDSGEDARNLYYAANDLLVELKKVIYNQDHGHGEKETQKMIKDLMDEYEEKIEKASKEFKQVSQSLEKEKNKRKRKKLEKQLKDLEEEVQALDIELKRRKFETVDKLKFEKELAYGTYDVEGATSQEDWQESFAGLITSLLQRSLFDKYALPDGCLDDYPFAAVFIYTVDRSDYTSDISKSCRN